MALFDDASLVVTPNGYKEGTLYSIKPTSGLGDMTVVRATTATRVNSAGLIELVPYNLIEYSEQFNNAAWSTQDATITANSTTAPNGTLTADTFTRTANTAFLYATNAFSLITGSYSISVYAKANTTSSFRLDLGSSGLSQGVTCTFNLSTATAGTPILYGSASSFVATIENVGNGWYRCSLSGNLISANYYAELAITTTGSIYIWGAQLVEGTLPKDYLRTETRLNIPRLDYSNGTCPSLLVEPQRTNLVLYSEQFDNAGWGKSGVTITANNTTSPDGTSNADLVTTTNATSHELLQSKIVTGVHTCSFYVKKNNSQTFYINMYSNGWTAYFNLNNGTVSSVVGSGVTANVTNAGNGWYRCSITFTSVGSEIQLGFLDTVYTGVAGNPWTIPTSIGTSGWVWGAQLEAGSYPTSYIPTTSAAVTRNADVISKTGISSLIGQTEGVLFVDFVYNGNYGSATNAAMPISIDDASGNNEGYIFLQGVNNTAYAQFVVGGSFTCNITGLVMNVGTRYKMAFAYKQNDFAFYINGVLQGVDTSGNIAALSNVRLCNYTGLNYIHDNLNSAVLFPTRLTNAELASLTTI